MTKDELIQIIHKLDEPFRAKELFEQYCVQGHQALIAQSTVYSVLRQLDLYYALDGHWSFGSARYYAPPGWGIRDFKKWLNARTVRGKSKAKIYRSSKRYKSNSE